MRFFFCVSHLVRVSFLAFASVPLKNAERVLLTEHVGPPHLQIFHKIQSLKSVIEYVRPKATLTIHYLLSSHLCTKFECWSKPARKYQTNENINKSNTVRIQYLK